MLEEVPPSCWKTSVEMLNISDLCAYFAFGLHQYFDRDFSGRSPTCDRLRYHPHVRRRCHSLGGKARRGEHPPTQSLTIMPNPRCRAVLRPVEKQNLQLAIQIARTARPHHEKKAHLDDGSMASYDRPSGSTTATRERTARPVGSSPLGSARATRRDGVDPWPLGRQSRSSHTRPAAGAEPSCWRRETMAPDRA